jgi:glycosyltransferase involved in cell wall biosynthesis
MVRTLAVTWGDPHSAFTYSGVPWHLFAELDRRGELVGRADADQRRRADLLRGTLDLRRSVADRRPRANALWRYLPANIEVLSERFAAVQRTMPDHDTVLQFGIAGIPQAAALVAHVEIPVEMAVSTPAYARSYGYDRVSARDLDRVLEGQRAFLDACSIVWTNSPWTADAFVAAGCPAEKVRWCPPGCGAADPGRIERDWSRCHIVFVGKDWERKGGPGLLDAFRAVRARRPDARLTVIGCRPDLSEPGVSVLGYLRKDVPAEAAVIDAALREATIFCMPSLWESTGLVYMEAALYGLPVVMVAGQGREDIFTAGALILDDADPERLAQALLDLADDPSRMSGMGAAGRSLVLDRFMWPRVAETVAGYLAEAADPRSLQNPRPHLRDDRARR